MQAQNPIFIQSAQPLNARLPYVIVAYLEGVERQVQGVKALAQALLPPAAPQVFTYAQDVVPTPRKSKNPSPCTYCRQRQKKCVRIMSQPNHLCERCSKDGLQMCPIAPPRSVELATLESFIQERGIGNESHAANAGDCTETDKGANLSNEEEASAKTEDSEED